MSVHPIEAQAYVSLAQHERMLMAPSLADRMYMDKWWDSIFPPAPFADRYLAYRQAVMAERTA